MRRRMAAGLLRHHTSLSAEPPNDWVSGVYRDIASGTTGGLTRSRERRGSGMEGFRVVRDST